MEAHGASSNTGFSWLQPHTRFVVVLVGPDETPFGLQKDFLCFKSSYYRAYFADHPTEQLEHIVHLPEATEEVFGLIQNFIYTGRLLTGVDELPAYDILIATWKVGHKLVIDGLCDDVLEAMTECKRLTQHIPATPLLVQVWNDTPEGSSIRQLLLTWAAEYIRSSESRSEFSKSLPQEVLSELVIAMSHLDSSPVIQVNHGGANNTANQRKNVRYLEAADSDEEPRKKITKHRHSDVASVPSPAAERTPTGPSERRKPGPRASLPNLKAPKARKNHNSLPSDHQFTAEQKLNFCSDLLTRMLSGPGFWTRLVGPFRQPVNPVEDGVPDYFEKVAKPMDLGTIKDKMDRGEYKDEEEFVTDIRQIFLNCFTYWTNKDPMWATCEKFQKTFEEKYSSMSKWLHKMEGGEDLL